MITFVEQTVCRGTHTVSLGMPTLPNLSSLILPDVTGARRAPISTQHKLSIPDYAVRNVFRKKLRPEAHINPGILVSAGKSRKLDFERLKERNPPTVQWVDGYAYAYYGGRRATAFIVAWCHFYKLSFTLLGGYLVDPKSYLWANIDLFWTASGRVSNGALIDIFQRDGAVEQFYEFLWKDKRLPALNSAYDDLSQLLDALKRGEQLPMMWSDDGMTLLEEFSKDFYHTRGL